ncbi:hypothetical protein BDL97_02G075400 [Sphagnum fallax]|jgi:hypothetical protein|uniref:Tetraspanin n=2 Tax=Sphagnum jensenii TaxID=128206 RepID=A0ABP0WRQ3_9BRYO|nr:hypothetical protein BDL97_02G075400 [Sphagnum fallax]KAH8970191.1 hypothetical protein BDL97_02G075400 [Sphagnum fallax]KAH8970192.1 hypothetical protein BDL97_02G075400 [Sphagnum fallax]KAH8970193.1 hypothetical protein BDL97_02G075400 [Sphagnum fallax]
MAGRSIKGQLAFVSTGLLSILNLLATIGGIAGIVIICALEHAPSSIGWLLIVVGGFTVASGLVGIFTSNRRGCFTWQAVLLMFALVGLILASLVIFFKPTLVLQRMNLKISESSARKIMKFQAAIFFIVFCIDVMVLILGTCVNCCDLVDYYEDLELANRKRADLGSTQAESGRRSSKKEDTKASQLAQKMKDKYGKWTSDGESNTNRRATLG